MNIGKRIAKNTAVLFVAKLTSLLLGFLYITYTARYLGPANYGILSFALALNGIFGVIANFGLDPLTVREVARDKNLAKKYLANGLVLKLLFGTLTFLIVLIVADISGYPQITKMVVLIITLSTIVSGINKLFSDIYQAFERMEFMSLGQILQSMLYLVFAVTVIKLGLDVVYFAMIYLIVNLCILGYHTVVITWKFLKPKIEADLNFWKSIVREAWPFALTAVFISIYYWVDSVMLSYMKGDEVVGWYNAAYRIIMLSLTVPALLNISIYPSMSYYWKSDQKVFYKLFNGYFTLMLPLAALLGVSVTALSNSITLIIFGSKYLPSAKILKILIWAPVSVYLSSPYGRLLEASNKQQISAKITGSGALINVALNLVLIPQLSAEGAAIATVLTEAFITSYVIIYSKKAFGISPHIEKEVLKLIRSLMVRRGGSP
ncbi:flippase [Palaeococcus ferrophilus]|uniref:flippase n=1 Tax=Palaeococcus ferrophilus TaxID=83868 RepID=UPI0006982951|nr:flippase [Palaeococcus ferrophilus]